MPEDQPAKAIRAGDTVLVRAIKEKWLVAAVSPDGKRLVCCGWPESLVDVTECDLLRACDDEEHIKLLNKVAGGGRSGVRSYWARENLRRLQQKGDA